MKATVVIRRFLLPSIVVTALCWIKFRCFVSPRAEVELTRFLKIGTGTQIGSFTKIKTADGPLDIGERVAIGNGVFISSHEGGIEIGSFCLISANVSIVGTSYRYDDLETPIALQGTRSKGIRLGDNVWVGANCTILDGVTIGHGAVIAANSLVSNDLPNNAIAQGNPAKVVFVRR